ncbi:flagellar protein [Lachnospiraceae bacterium OttesenSCG-928-D06]|nr:flagellar protein [Lachnospiraceae bacterium OttesenSCG-928-D06]
MNVRNCRGCGKLFNYVAGPPTCPACREKMEKKFQEVKTYIRENTGASISEVAEACEVDSGQIRQWIRDDRLELTENSPIRLSCESCGEQIRSGKYCEKCKNQVASGFNDILQSAKPKEAPKMQKTDKDNPKMRFLK